MIGERRRLDAELEKENEKEIEREAIEQEKIRKAYDQAFHQQVMLNASCISLAHFCFCTNRWRTTKSLVLPQH